MSQPQHQDDPELGGDAQVDATQSENCVTVDNLGASTQVGDQGDEPDANLSQVVRDEPFAGSDDATEWKCDVCVKYFCNGFSLRRHVEGVHLKAYSCRQCSRAQCYKTFYGRKLRIFVIS